jgi:hypothetical protein
MKPKSQISIRNIRNKGTQPPRLADARQPRVVPSNAQVSVLPRFREDVHLVAWRAYELYEARGRGEGRALEDWLNAEHEILGESAPVS